MNAEQVVITSDDSLGGRLRQLREAKANRLGRRKIPQREVADHFKVTAGAYASWETNRTRPDLSLLPQIAAYFEVSIDVLLNYASHQPYSQKAIGNQSQVSWSLLRPAQTENEKKGIRAFDLLIQGATLDVIAQELDSTSSIQKEVERYIKDVIYTDMIQVHNPPLDRELARRIKHKYGLREVYVAATAENSYFMLNLIFLAEIGRTFFKQFVRPGMKVGLAGGSSISRLVYALKRGECQSIEVYPLAISPAASEAIAALDANTLVGTLAYRHEGYDVRGYTLQYASQQLQKEYRNLRQVALTKRILIKARSIDIGFIGLGNLNFRLAPIDLLGDLLSTWGLTREEIKNRGAVGDILYNFVDASGNLVTPTLSDFICGIELVDLNNMVLAGIPIVVLASGKDKAAITRVAIQSGYINVLIVDDQLARSLLRLES